MTASRAARRPPDPASGDRPDIDRSSPPRAPKFLHYLLLTLAFWGFLVIQAIVLIRSLGSGQMVYLFSTILGLGFLAVCVFDYAWLRWRR